MIERPVLVERTRELRALHEVAEQVRAGGAHLVLITGEAGLGKSTLHTAFRHELGPEWRVEFVDGHHTDRSFDAPFGRLAGTIEPGDDPSHALADAVAGVLRSLVDGGPALLVVEDLHFLDPATVLALPPLLDALADVPVLLVVTSRPSSPWGDGALTEPLAALRRHPRVTELALEPLSAQGIDVLLHRGAGPDAQAPSDGTDAARTTELGAGAHAITTDAHELHRRTGGNPFFVDALLHTDPTDRSVPWTVAEMVFDLLEDLGAAPRAAAELLAVEGGPLPVSLLDATAREPDRAATSSTPGASEALRQSGLAVIVSSAHDGTAQARLRHALVADAIRSLLDPATTVGRHRSLAEVMEVEGAERAEDLARHWSAAGESRRAAPWAGVAADRLLASGSHQRATEMYEVALVHPPDTLRDRAALLERAAMAAAYAGHADQARRWGEAARHARANDQGPWEDGRGLVNAVLLRSVEDAHGDTTSTADEATRQASIEQANAALELMLEGDLAGAERLLVGVIERAEATGELALASVAWSRRARLRAVAGDWGGCVALNDRGLALARQAGGPDLWANLALSSAFLTALGGNLDDALARCAETDGLDLPLVSELARAARLAVALERGHLELASDELDVLRPLVRALGVPYYSVPVLCLDMRFRLLTGDVESAAHALEEIDGFGWGAHHDYSHDVLVARAIVASERGRADELMTVQEQVAALAEHHRGDQWLAARQFTVGLSASAADASAAFAAAARHWEAAPRAGWAADAWCAAARATADAGARDEALARATTLADRHRIDRVHWLVAVERSQATAAPSPRGRAPATAALESLTERERAVVVAAAGGATNPEIAEMLGLSDRTVRNYLSSAFAKLGVTRRAQLADLLG
jgi:DNA-binding NarL/FixJ family response regulator